MLSLLALARIIFDYPCVTSLMTDPIPAITALEVRQHNAITTARYEMTACEMDIVFYLLSLLRKEDRIGTFYQIKVLDLMTLTGREWNYQQFLEATSALRTREYVFEDNNRLLQVGLLASAEYLKGEGVIELEISEKIRPYFIDLKRNFTSFRLQAAFGLNSKYAKRIYQIVSQWKDKSETRTFSLHDLKVMLALKDPKGIEPEQYTKVSMFKKHVLDIAVSQINQGTDLQIAYKLHKKGRAFDRITFTVETQQPQQLPIPFEDTIGHTRIQTARQRLDELQIHDPRLVDVILGDERYIAELFSFIHALKTNKIKATSNAGGLFLTKTGLREVKLRKNAKNE
jgi:plasmid replication initiation protein